MELPECTREEIEKKAENRAATTIRVLLEYGAMAGATVRTNSWGTSSESPLHWIAKGSIGGRPTVLELL